MNNSTCFFLNMPFFMFPPLSNPVIMLLLFTAATKASHSYCPAKGTGSHVHIGYTHFVP